MGFCNRPLPSFGYARMLTDVKRAWVHHFSIDKDATEKEDGLMKGIEPYVFISDKRGIITMEANDAGKTVIHKIKKRLDVPYIVELTDRIQIRVVTKMHVLSRKTKAEICKKFRTHAKMYGLPVKVIKKAVDFYMV